MKRVVVHIMTPTGHNKAYQKLFSVLFFSRCSIGGLTFRKILELVKTKDGVFFPTVDTDYSGFLIVSLLRSFLFKKTAGLLLRPPNDLLSYKNLLKYIFLHGLKIIPYIRIYSIVPFDVRPIYKNFCFDWIYDPQIWDLEVFSSFNCALRARSSIAREFVNNKLTVLIAGSISKGKGLDEVFGSLGKLASRYNFIIAGLFSPEYKIYTNSSKIENVYIVDRFITDEELYDFYASSNLVWCKYDESYDYPSGIFGRAIQFGKLPIIRVGSLLNDLADHCGVQYVSSLLDDQLLLRSCDYSSNNVNISKKCYHSSIQKINDLVDWYG